MRVEQGLSFLNKIRSIDDTMSATTAIVLLLVARAGDAGITPAEIHESMEITLSGPRRHADLLGDRGRGNKAGLGLIDEQYDPVDRRTKYLKLTPKGKKFIASL